MNYMIFYGETCLEQRQEVDKMLLSNIHNRKDVRGCCLYCYVDCGTYATGNGESTVD